MCEDALFVCASYALDLLVGDPQAWPHPVRGMGWAIARGERIVRRCAPPTPRGELIAGAALACAVVGSSFAAYAAFLRIARSRSLRFGTPLGVLCAASTLATRSLLDEADAVAGALENGDLPKARLRLARIVGRDTEDLCESEIARATIEALAESLCDGVTAPLCALSLGGVPGAMALKAINTLDSMIGHPEPPYTFFGRFAARLDDAANFIPARLTALFIALTAGQDAGRAWRIWRRDGSKHRSPNAGQCEAAMAGALGVRLGGENRYDGIIHDAPKLGAELRAPEARDVREAMRRTLIASAAGAVSAVLARRFLGKHSR